MILLSATGILPSDFRAKQGALLFLGMLLVFFLSSLLLYALYAISRRDDPYSSATLPWSFLVSTVCLVAISGLVHLATRSVRRDRFFQTTALLSVSSIAAIVFLAIQVVAMSQMLQQTTLQAGNGRGLVGMVVVLAFLHALHVAGGVIALGIVAVRSALGRYDHERHFAVDFSAQYWHFLDIIWIAMLAAFWFTTGGF